MIPILFLGQVFCGMACVTSCSARSSPSRATARAGLAHLEQVNASTCPVAAVLGSCALALIITIPALWGTSAGIPVAFFAVVSIAVIGLYIAYVMPVYLRLRGGNFTPAWWTLGAGYRWVNTIAVVWVALCVVIFSLPFTPAAVPWNDEFDWSALNYAPLTVGGLFLAVWLWWARREEQVQGASADHRLRRGHGHHRGGAGDEEPPDRTEPPAPATA